MAAIDHPLDEGELLAALRIDAATLAAWIRDGLPHVRRHKQRRFKGEDVRAWLIATGKAKPQRIVATCAEVAAAIGVSERYVHTLLKAHGMPGEPGAFDLDLIEAWWEARKKPSGGDEDLARARMADAEAAWKELRTAKAAGKLYEVEAARRLILRLTTEASAILEQVPDRVMALLPAKPPRAKQWTECRHQWRKAAMDIITDVRRTLADLPRSQRFGGSEDAPEAKS